MTESRNINFREGRTTIILPGVFSLMCKKAMYALDTPRIMINYWDLITSEIHASTALKNDEEVLELMQGLRIFATAYARDDGLYKIVIKPIIISTIYLIDEKNVCMMSLVGDPETKHPNLTMGVSLDITTKPDIWHRRLGHPEILIFRRMLPLIISNNLTISNVHKTHDCIVIFRKNL